MWEGILQGAQGVLTLDSLWVLIAGSIAGAVIGALPGLSAVSAVALLLPFTFGMEPAQGLIMLAAVYTSAQYGGSIPAILINTPGTSGAAATTLDGYPMTLKGQAQEALYLQLFAGVFGGTIGALILIFFTPTLAAWSLLMGPAEYFWLAVAGLAMVASLAGRDILKGLIGAALGVMLTVPGQDLITGDSRFTFDTHHLIGGIELVPALLGFFAVASVVALVERGDETVAPLTPRPGVIRYVLKRMYRMKLLLSWTGVLGTVVGSIPGAGASISAFVAYSESKRISKNHSEFGKGAWEGVAGPESANNGVVGGSIVPLLGLGLPGSGTAAVMFGALTVHGIIPGPRMFEDRADIAYTFMLGVLATIPIMLIIGLVTVRWSSLAVRAPLRFMVPAILSLAVMGTFSLRQNTFDVGVLIVVGLIAYLLHKVGVPPIAMALGLVLGTLIEQNLQRTVIVAGTRDMGLWEFFFSRPIAIGLMLVGLFVLLSGVRQVVREHSEEKSAGGGGEPEETAVTAAGDAESGTSSGHERPDDGGDQGPER